MKKRWLVCASLIGMTLLGCDTAKDIAQTRTPAPNIAGDWVGTAAESAFPFTKYTVEAHFDPVSGKVIHGHVLWYDDSGGHAKEVIEGELSSAKDMTFHGTADLDVVNNDPREEFIVGKYSATLSDDGTTLAGGWLSEPAGSFKLTRKPPGP